MNNELSIDKPFINIKVKNGAEKISCEFYDDGKLARYFDVELGGGDDYDFYVFYDVREFIGKTLRIETSKPLSNAIDEIFAQSEEPLETGALYDEANRPQFHFSSRRGWLNDPNGLIFHNGEYHLFYQHNPFGRTWGNMHWGHAVSNDLFHWRERPTALFPDEFGAMYSGCAVFDKENTSGLENGKGEGPIVLLYTAEGKRAPRKTDTTQCLAWSNDGGMSFTKLQTNPVLPQVCEGNRDPHVFWHRDSKQWIMSLYLRKINAVIHEFAIYASSNLKGWRELDRFQMPSYECPGLCEFSVANEPGVKKWVFWGAEGCYLVGDFNGEKFIPTQGVLFDGTNQIDNHGRAYAGQTFSNMPDNRVVKISWMQGGELPGMPFNQFMTLPVDVSLRKTDSGYLLAYTPVKEIETCYAENIELKQVSSDEMNNALKDVDAKTFDATLRVSSDSPATITVKGIDISWDPKIGLLECLGRQAVIRNRDKNLACRVVVDVASIEIFADNGLAYLPFGVPVDSNAPVVSIESKDSTIKTDLVLSRIKSIWK